MSGPRLVTADNSHSVQTGLAQTPSKGPARPAPPVNGRPARAIKVLRRSFMPIGLNRESTHRGYGLMKHEVAQSICAARVVLQSLRVLTMMLASALGDAEEPGRGRKAKLAHGRAEAPAEADALDRRRQARQATERTAAAREAGMGVAPVLAPNWVLAPSPIWGRAGHGWDWRKSGGSVPAPRGSTDVGVTSP